MQSHYNHTIIYYRSINISSSILTIISLLSAQIEAPCISTELVDILERVKKSGQKSLIFYSRRGNARAWICTDCGHYEKCPNCDIAFAYHTNPHKCLICHHCSQVSPFPIVCPKCGGSQINPVGVGIQQIEEHLMRLLSKDTKILRIDSDTRDKTEVLYHKIGDHDIILSTQIGNSIVHRDIGAVVWLSFELNLSIPSYHIEEDIYNEISYYKKQGLPLYIQTYIPDHPLLREIMDGNTKSFLSYLGRERKVFGYPPFMQLATIRIHDEQKKKVEDIMRKLVNKIGIIKKTSTFFAFDTEIRERYNGEWQQKIILKDIDVSYITQELEVEIVRNRSVTLEWN